MVKQVFWIGSVKFVSQLVESTLKGENMKCYTHESDHDFQFILDDIKPDLVIIDAELVNDASLKEISQSKVSKVALFADENEFESLKDKFNFCGQLHKPLEVMEMVQSIKSLL
jgi:DNA-binding response OmpR family regulator